MNTKHTPRKNHSAPLRRKGAGIGRFAPQFKNLISSSALLMLLCVGGVASAGLIQQWTGDHYTSGNWTDDVGGIVATASGSPLAVTNAFGPHHGGKVNGGG